MSTTSQNQLQPELDTEFLELARVQWCSDAQLHVLEFLSGGYSGAAVLLVDVERRRANSEIGETEVKGGLHILKLDRFRARNTADADEAQRHSEATQWAPAFAAEHLPALERTTRDGAKLALLYRVAGNSLTRLARADLLGIETLQTRIQRTSYQLLSGFNRQAAIEREYTNQQIFSEWLGERLTPSGGLRLQEVAASLVGEKRAFVRSCRVIANPVKLALEGFGEKPLRAVFSGMLHGDLHRENIFWERLPEGDRFWLIDLAFARRGPLLFDHAYLELSLLLQKFEQQDPARLLNLLDSLRQPPESIGARFVPSEDYGILTICRALRAGIGDWQAQEQELRPDSVREQWCLARVAVGLNWANKRINDVLRHLAFWYAGHAAREYLEEFHSEEWRRWSADADSDNTYSLGDSGATESAWHELWNEMLGFSNENAYFVLITGPLRNKEAAASLGFLPWSVVIDLDPDSDSGGLLERARNNLEQQRAVQIFGRNVIPVNFARSTAWMLASGATALNEESPKSLSDWRRQYKGAIRQIGVDLRSASAPTPVRVLILPGEDDCFDRAARAIEEIADELGSDRRIVVATTDHSERWKRADVDNVIALSADELTRRTGAIFGVASTERRAVVPGKDGPVQLDAQKIRNFEEDFEVLHSDILSSGTYEEYGDAFWRGAPPSWRDVETDTPVHRNIDKLLLESLRGRLRENRTVKVELFHTPGAGGTTASLVLAWSLRRQFPTCRFASPLSACGGSN